MGDFENIDRVFRLAQGHPSVFLGKGHAAQLKVRHSIDDGYYKNTAQHPSRQRKKENGALVESAVGGAKAVCKRIPRSCTPATDHIKCAL
ncbi:MAG: hypothetical protein IKV44_06140 [Clostridia bacterium]|nr:hypothetical protein [Clostridia bacterium]